MRVKFAWTTSGNKQKEFCDVELQLDNLPRVGELVELSVQVTQIEWLNKAGRVKDVIYQISARDCKVTVLLGA